MFEKIRATLKNIKLGTVTFYMKSGNAISCDRTVIDTLNIKYTGDRITAVTGFRQIKPKHRMIIQSISLDQIEAITVVD